MIKVRRLSDSDIGSVTNFFLTIRSPNYCRNFSPHPFTRAESSRVCSHRGRDLYLGAFPEEAGTQMIGYGMLRGLDEGYSVPALGLCVLEESQSRGVGKMLLTHLLHACAVRGADRAMLKVKRDNLRAYRLYAKAGFQFEVYDHEFLIGYCAVDGWRQREAE